MNNKKYPDPDPDFYPKIRGVCRNDYERGMVYILQHTGMHISSLCDLQDGDIDLKGFIHWRRPKNDKPMRSLIPKGDIPGCEKWILMWGENRRSHRAIQYKIATIGERAGYPGLAAMSFRTQYACTLLDEGTPPHKVVFMMGCSLETLMNHYTQLEQARKIIERDKK